MNVVQFGESACDKTRRYLDAYLSNELLVETSQEVQRHLETCPQCSAELAARARLRGDVRAAVRRSPVPAGLEARIRQALGARPALRWYGRIAAVLILGVAVFLIWRMRPNSAEETLMREATRRLSAVLNVGMRDHLNCAVFGKYPKQPEPASEMAADLGPQFAGLPPMVQAKMPAGFRIIQGHHCDYHGRQYTHLIAIRNGKLLSVILTRKQPGESVNGISQAGFDRYQIVGFESNDYLGYVVSDLDAQQNLQLAASLASAVRDYLAAHAG